jgi:hypothetical protein
MALGTDPFDAADNLNTTEAVEKFLLAAYKGTPDKASLLAAHKTASQACVRWGLEPPAIASGWPSRRYRAFGAVDDLGDGHLVFDPIDPATDLERHAVPLGPTCGLSHAEILAADFNEGRTWAFRVGPGQVLVGDQIPSLHRGPV